jgi:hypothetical protein
LQAFLKISIKETGLVEVKSKSYNYNGTLASSQLKLLTIIKLLNDRQIDKCTFVNDV